MKKKTSDSLENLLYRSSKLADAVNLITVSFIVVFSFCIDSHILKSFLISSMSIIVVLLYYVRINFQIFDKSKLIINDLVCMIFWLVISAFWFCEMFNKLQLVITFFSCKIIFSNINFHGENMDSMKGEPMKVEITGFEHLHLHQFILIFLCQMDLELVKNTLSEQLR